MPKTPVRRRIGQASPYRLRNPKSRRSLITSFQSEEDLPCALCYNENSFVSQLDIGNLTQLCTNCSALKFPGEPPSLCCCNGKVILPVLPPPPPYLKSLYDNNCPDSEHFLKNIRSYNCAFQMTSFGCNQRTIQGWNPTFTIHGQVSHRIGSLLPEPGQDHKFLQVYFIDSVETEIERRCQLADGLRHHIVNKVREELNNHNEYVRDFKSAHDFIVQNDTNNSMQIVIQEAKRPQGEHARRFNSPVCSEIAILMPNEPVNNRDIIIQQRSGPLHRITEIHRSYDPLQYPILLPYGTDGYNVYLKSSSNARKITQLQFYSFHLMMRANNYLLASRRLFQQYIVDAYCKIETERLNFIRREQTTLRADSYSEIRDSLQLTDGNTSHIGSKVILPATFTGGPRYMHERQMDAMAYVQKFGRPDLFITATTNPNWPDVTTLLMGNESAQDRPDIIVRVFQQKLKKLMGLIKDGCFGTVTAWLYSIEYQKRGLPHAHILVWLSSDSKIRAENIDKAVSATIPCPETNPELHRIVIKHMVHGPCGALNKHSPCMVSNSCTKNFPKPFVQETQLSKDGYPLYRRPAPDDGGREADISVRNYGQQHTITIDNRWIVPYNPWLLRQMDAHVNVELCMSVKSIKYVLKYVTKGCDQAVFTVNGSHNDEVATYQHARYVGSTEAAWRIFEYPIHNHYPPVTLLAIHLENGQRVFFQPNTAAQVVERGPPATTLTAFFALSQTDMFAKTLLYPEVPQFYTWNKSTKQWNRRKRGSPHPTVLGVFQTPCIGRVYTVSPKLQECYFLRLLLHHVRGPSSFNDLCTIDGEVTTYRLACIHYGLIENDSHLQLAMTEAALSRSPFVLRTLFAVILTSCEPSAPNLLWTLFKDDLSEDFLHHDRSVTNNTDLQFCEQHYNSALLDIEQKVQQMSGRGLEIYDLPKPVAPTPTLTRDIALHFMFNAEEQRQFVHSNLPKLTNEQRSAYESFMELVLNGSHGVVFLDAPGGTGKTFLLNLILAALRAENRIPIAAASSGIAATLLAGGRTVHSTFKVPINIQHHDRPMCSISKQSSLSQFLQSTSAIVIDEAPMLHRSVLEAVDRSLQDIRSSILPMGGIPTLLCGDFRQILPVIRNGTRANIVDSSLKHSPLWQHVTVLHLHKNMRAHLLGDENAETFSKLLLEIGDGQYPVTTEPNRISLPQEMHTVPSTDALITAVFEDIHVNANNEQWLKERIILSPLNESVNAINQKVIESFPGDPTTYRSIDTALSDEEAINFPVEFLNSLDIPGLPPHRLFLKKGCPIIVLRSLDPPNITNGTRCVILQLLPNVIEVRILTGPAAGNVTFIPRIPLIPSDGDIPFQFKRLQFPVRPCFAMTINKSQGQTFLRAGLDFSHQIFAHGMLYVALSRVGALESLSVYTPESVVANVVYPEVL